VNHAVDLAVGCQQMQTQENKKANINVKKNFKQFKHGVRSQITRLKLPKSF